MPDSPAAPVITFLSDYGLADEFVGICHGVMARICPEAKIIDLTHGIPRHDARAGAIVLRGALPYLPVGVHLAVVDPDVGAERRAIALRLADGRVLVGPDNGLLAPAAGAGGGIVEAVDIARSPHRLQPVSATFHGRDIFAPVAAAVAAGAPVADVGDPLEPSSVMDLELPEPRRDGDALIVHVRYIDRFGNVQLDAGHQQLGDSGLKLGRPVRVELADGTAHQINFARTFAEAGRGELLLYEDAQRQLALAVRHGDAAAVLGLGVDAELRIRPG